MMSCLVVPSGPHAAMVRQHGGNFIAFKPRIQESSPGPPRSASPDSIASSEGSLQECSFMDPFQWWENRNRKQTDPRDTNLKGSMNDGMNGSHIPDGFKDMDIVGKPRDDEMDMVLEHGQAGAFEGQKLQEKSQEILLRHGHKPGVKADVIEVQKIKGWEMLCMEDMISYLEALGVDAHPSMEIFIYILQKCKKHKNIRYAKRIHSHVCSVGLEAHRELGNYLIPMFVECGIVSYAEQISCRLVYRNEICWTSLIQGFIKSGEPLKTFDLFQKMQQDGVHPSKHTFVALLKASARLKAVRRGQELHDKIAKEGFEGNPFIGNALVDMYAKCGSFAEARDVFDKQPIRDVVSWTALITGYAQHGLGTESLSCVKQMQKESVFPDSVAFVCGLKACGNMQDIDQGREIHTEIAKEGFERDALVGSTLVDMYSKCGSVREAQEVFDKLPHHGVVLWNVLIAGYAEHGLFEESINCLKQMRLEGVSSDAVTFLGILKACGSLKAIGKGQELHMEIVKQGFERDLSVCNSLVGMYAKVGLLKEAWEVFDDMLDRDVVSWTALIAGYAEHGLGEEALKCFKQMQLEGVSPNVVTFVCSLKACGSIEAIRRGQEIHVEIAKEGFERDSCVGNTLVDMYAKCGSLVEAWEVFNELLVQDVVSWSAMILGYADQGESEMAFTLYARMQEQGLLPNSVTFVNILTACGKTAALETGKRIHAQIYSIGGAQAVEVIISTALIHMYCKCGSMDDAQQMFDAMSKRELAKWNALITGYSRQGETQLVLQLFEEMRAQRVLPNGVTFLSVLTACSHAGLVDRGHKYFEAMTKEYGITLTIRHHNCMIDLFSRAGQFQEATTRLKKMPFEPNYVTWNTLLGACKKWGNKELGRQAFECAVKLDEKHDAAYLLMFQIYEDARMWEDAKKIEAMRMKARRAQKQQGKSWIEIEGCVHTFVVGDMGHPQREDMYAKLKQLFVKMEERHRLGFDRVLQDIFSNAKEDVSGGHSEILAIACGIINTPERTTIRVAKNLRVCDYCHSMAALISKAEQRTIICSDASLSHVFRNGNCSCGDYW